MPQIPPTALGRIAGLNDTVARLDGKLADERGRLKELRNRRADLQRRLDQRASVWPAEEFMPDVTLTEAMAAAPGEIGAETRAELERQQDHHAAVLKAWNADAALFTSAAASLDSEIAASEAVVQSAVCNRDGAWANFVVETHALLAAHFRDTFLALRTDVIEPMLAFQAQVTAERNPIVPGTALRIDRLSVLKMDHYAVSRQPELLHPIPASRDDQAVTIERFRASLPQRGG